VSWSRLCSNAIRHSQCAYRTVLPFANIRRQNYRKSRLPSTVHWSSHHLTAYLANVFSVLLAFSFQLSVWGQRMADWPSRSLLLDCRQLTLQLYPFRQHSSHPSKYTLTTTSKTTLTMAETDVVPASQVSLGLSYCSRSRHRHPFHRHACRITKEVKGTVQEGAFVAHARVVATAWTLTHSSTCYRSSFIRQYALNPIGRAQSNGNIDPNRIGTIYNRVIEQCSNPCQYGPSTLSKSTRYSAVAIDIAFPWLAWTTAPTYAFIEITSSITSVSDDLGVEKRWLPFQ